VPLPNEFFRQPGNDSFRAAVEFWRHGLSQGSDERNAHMLSFHREALLVWECPDHAKAPEVFIAHVAARGGASGFAV
jgi:hypothetical protein